MGKHAVKIGDVVSWLDLTLEPHRFADYCPNGLQVQGKPNVHRIVTGVTASLALVEAAIERHADAILVHHGWFWKGEDPTIRGARKRRVQAILASDVSLLAYHLPLDAHPVLGNNAQLALKLGLVPERDASGQPVSAGVNGLIWFGRPQVPMTTAHFAAKLTEILGRAPVVVGDLTRSVGRVAWCTGAAQGMFETAIDAGADVYITGEISEPNAHLARECGVTFISAGHHATERYGIQALGQALSKALDIEVQFVDIDNPA
jgi:dinuclear metal center YbgI/SA1388 family protein